MQSCSPFKILNSSSRESKAENISSNSVTKSIIGCFAQSVVKDTTSTKMKESSWCCCEVAEPAKSGGALKPRGKRSSSRERRPYSAASRSRRFSGDEAKKALLQLDEDWMEHCSSSSLSRLDPEAEGVPCPHPFLSGAVASARLARIPPAKKISREACQPRRWYSRGGIQHPYFSDKVKIFINAIYGH